MNIGYLVIMLIKTIKLMHFCVFHIHLPYTYTSALVVPRTVRSTIGDLSLIHI